MLRIEKNLTPEPFSRDFEVFYVGFWAVSHPVFAYSQSQRLLDFAATSGSTGHVKTLAEQSPGALGGG